MAAKLKRNDGGQADGKTELKNIVILATGGTIAGKAASGTQMTGYTAGAYSVADLLAGVPELGKLAHISGEQLCNIDSSSITDALLLRLAQRCNELLAQDDVDGVVIIHGYRILWKKRPSS